MNNFIRSRDPGVASTGLQSFAPPPIALQISVPNYKKIQHTGDSTVNPSTSEKHSVEQVKQDIQTVKYIEKSYKCINIFILESLALATEPTVGKD